MPVMNLKKNNFLFSLFVNSKYVIYSNKISHHAMRVGQK